MANAPDAWLLDGIMRGVRPGVVSGQLDIEELPDFECLLAAAAVMHLDGYIVAKNLGLEDLDAYHDLVQGNVASSNLYRETIEVARSAVSAVGRRAAKALHAPNTANKAAALADWEACGKSFSSMRAFARMNFGKYVQLDSGKSEDEGINMCGLRVDCTACVYGLL